MLFRYSASAVSNGMEGQQAPFCGRMSGYPTTKTLALGAAVWMSARIVAIGCASAVTSVANEFFPLGVIVIPAVGPDLCRAPRGEGDAVLDDAGKAEIVAADLQADELSTGSHSSQLGRVIGTGGDNLGRVEDVGGGRPAAADVGQGEPEGSRDITWEVVVGAVATAGGAGLSWDLGPEV